MLTKFYFPMGRVKGAPWPPQRRTMCFTLRARSEATHVALPALSKLKNSRMRGAAPSKLEARCVAHSRIASARGCVRAGLRLRWLRLPPFPRAPCVLPSFFPLYVVLPSPPFLSLVCLFVPVFSQSVAPPLPPVFPTFFVSVTPLLRCPAVLFPSPSPAPCTLGVISVLSVFRVLFAHHSCLV